MNCSARRVAEVFLLTGALSGVLATSAPFARAQDVAAGATAELRPPELLERVQAAYPEAARSAGLEASVGLRLTIDGHGQVIEANVSEAAGHGFDEAAREAVRHFRFAPALRGGQPVQARLHFVYEFKLPPAPVVSEPEAVAEPGPGPARRERARRERARRERARGCVGGGRARATPNRARANRSGRASAGKTQRRRASPAVRGGGDRRRYQEGQATNGRHGRGLGPAPQGLSVRRYGGLGSSARISMNGLYDDQIRLFLDGVPLDLAGYPFGIENVPVNLIDRIEVYRGVVPVRFGADALGGAINLVSDQRYQNHLAASYQVGSFGTHRLSVGGRYTRPSLRAVRWRFGLRRSGAEQLPGRCASPPTRAADSPMPP